MDGSYLSLFFSTLPQAPVISRAQHRACLITKFEDGGHCWSETDLPDQGLVRARQLADSAMLH
jgi:hypothetical protein